MTKVKEENYIKGREGESLARDFLMKKGFGFVEANFENVIGEIDLIMIDGDWLVFVEVKLKSDDKFGMPEEMIGSWKIRQIKRVAESFLLENKDELKNFVKYRVDAVCILGTNIKHYENIE